MTILAGTPVKKINNNNKNKKNNGGASCINNNPKLRSHCRTLNNYRLPGFDLVGACCCCRRCCNFG